MEPGEHFKRMALAGRAERAGSGALDRTRVRRANFTRPTSLGRIVALHRLACLHNQHGGWGRKDRLNKDLIFILGTSNRVNEERHDFDV
jgi:hypothetical protein